jgi:hypothetical protein
VSLVLQLTTRTSADRRALCMSLEIMAPIQAVAESVCAPHSRDPHDQPLA